VVANILADNANAKIGLLIPTGIGGDENTYKSNEVLTFHPQKQNLSMWTMRKLMIDNFDGREAEKIWLVDIGSSIDTKDGYGHSTEPLFSEYSGINDREICIDSLHPSVDGYNQMGVRLAGFIQQVR